MSDSSPHNERKWNAETSDAHRFSQIVLILSVFICVDQLFLRHLRSIYGTESKLLMENAVSFVECDAEIRHFPLHFVIGFIDLAYLGVLIMFIRVIQRMP